MPRKKWPLLAPSTQTNLPNAAVVAVDVSVVEAVEVAVDVAVGKSLPSVDEPVASIAVPSGRRIIKLPLAIRFRTANAARW